MLNPEVRAPDGWRSSSDYLVSDLHMTISKFNEISDLLLERPNLNSTHLFRADIIHDSAGRLQTVVAKEQAYCQRNRPQHGSQSEPSLPISGEESSQKIDFGNGVVTVSSPDTVEVVQPSHSAVPFDISGFHLTRTVTRKLIPRKPQVDRVLTQSCFTYDSDGDGACSSTTPVLVTYVPHAVSEADVPWYHPPVKALAYQYDPQDEGGTLSICYKLFSESEEPISMRLHRTLLALLHTFVRLAKLDAPATNHVTTSNLPISLRPTNAAALRDSILPQHLVQDTYTRLKKIYAADLIARWAEKTDPSKHVFEDLAIAAFLIELWKNMYADSNFPGFVDVACGNGVLVYILIKEGYIGRGFDAKRRKTWEILGIDDQLEEMLCIPKPFLDVLADHIAINSIGSLKIHNGLFESGTFIISNHADELTPWTPILAALSDPKNYLPFLAIPCCSHALSGAKHRYSLRDVDVGSDGKSESDDFVEDTNPGSGDLKTLRAQKINAASHNDVNSTYACLTKKTVALAEEIGYETEMTLMRIPSTRNIGIIGNRNLQPSSADAILPDRVGHVIARECSTSGGIETCANIWVERASKLVQGKGRGKINLGSKPC